MKKYKSIDLFAGIGGIRLGFELAFGDSIETVFATSGTNGLKRLTRLILTLMI